MSNTEDKKAILECALKKAPFEGWTQSLLEHALEEAGFDRKEWKRFFPAGVVDLLDFYSDLSDFHMVMDTAPMNLSTKKIHERIMILIETRLKRSLPHREAIRRSVAFYALPMHAFAGFKALYKTLDEIWYQAGDTSTDFNFYTKRALLGAVFSSTVLFWLDDKSPNQVETSAFLKRRLLDVLKIQTFRKTAETAFANFANAPLAFFKRT